MKVRFTAAASTEIYEITRYYVAIDYRLGRRVIDRLTELQSALELNPRLGSRISGDNRRITMRSFPYDVYYQIVDSDNTVWIVSVLHQSRHPATWKDRVREEPAIYQRAA